MKKNEAFLPTWHAHLGYSLKLFDHFGKATTIDEVAQQGFNKKLLTRWVEVGLAVGHLKKCRRGKWKTKRKILRYLSKDSPDSIGILLKEMMELHIPTLLSYRDLMVGNDVDLLERNYENTVAETSRLLETLAFPKVYHLIKNEKIQSVLDFGCGHGGYLKRIHEKNNALQLTGIEIDEQVAKKARSSCKEASIMIEQRDLMTYQAHKPVDLVMMNNLLYYFSTEDRARLFKQASKALYPKGFLTIMSPLNGKENIQPFTSAFNSFMSAHEQMFPIPTKEELTEYGKNIDFQLKQIKPIIKEGGWYVIVFQKEK
ncbi:trans-aconitate 2-methyltransferase [Halalkalibacter sp. APA_J-10(15)]|uniref:class I SAM-dependent methyltransferase n=1 Tax=unclassified Halalkalibacter TaxID=2893063 RepID=UPI001FF2C776|nr:class I SAM-dependent methyltransferase [Halalkalibacter sp. APA_J-10(15)]MCK0471835.1 class I SAM-dependent methyltransferase [Halalkalibacter sp. APA_J-10(15)]